MEATWQFMQSLAVRGVALYQQDGALKYKAPKGKLLDSDIKQLREQREVILGLLANQTEDGFKPESLFAPANNEKVSIPVSSQQAQWLLLGEETNNDPALHNSPVALLFLGPLDCDGIERALQKLVERHEVLRSRFERRESGYFAYLASQPFALERIDLQGLSEAERVSGVQKQATDFAWRHFNVLEENCFRAALFMLGADQHVLVLSAYRAVADRVSIQVLLEEFPFVYTLAAGGESALIPTAPQYYEDYVKKQLSFNNGANLLNLERYWKDVYSTLPTLKLPRDIHIDAIATYRPEQSYFLIDAQTVSELTALANELGVSAWLVLFANYLAVISKWAGVRELGALVESDEHQKHQLRAMVGPLGVNDFLSACIDPATTFNTLIQKLVQSQIQSEIHRVDMKTHERLADHSLFFRIAPSLSPRTDLEPIASTASAQKLLGNLKMGVFPLGPADMSKAKPPKTRLHPHIYCTVSDSDGGAISGFFEAGPQYFRRDTITNLVEQFQLNLRCVLAEPNVALLP